MRTPLSVDADLPGYFWLLAISLVVAAACKPTPSANSPVDASDAAPYDSASLACAHLHDLGCPLGDSPNCAAAFRLPSKFGANASCALGAATVAGLAACNVTCQP